MHETAVAGLTGASSALPHQERIQRAFGHHYIGQTRAAVGGPAQAAAAELGASAYAADGKVAFAAAPDLRTAAHEAAHVVQQRGGVQLAGGVGRADDHYERHADAVADRVVRGESAAALLDEHAGGASAAGVQRKAVQFEPHDAGVPLPAGVSTPPPTEAENALYAATPMTPDLARSALSEYQANPDHEAWWARFSPTGQLPAVLRTAPPAEVAPAGALGATARDWLQRLGPAQAALAVQIGHSGIAIEWALSGATPWTAQLAGLALDQYEALGDADRATWFARNAPGGRIPAMLAVVPGAASAGGGAHQAGVRDLLQRIQRRETDATAAAVGLTDHSGMVDAEAAHLRTHPGVVAREHAAVHGRPRRAMTAAEATRENARINAVIPRFITHVRAHHPELGLTAARMRADALACYTESDAIAFAEQSSGIAVVGRRFATMVEADPAYAVPTIVHELYGHNEYGDYGAPGTEAGLDLYNEARGRIPGTRLTADQGLGSFGFIETEIYALLREVAYYTPNRPEHARITDNYSSEAGITDRLRAARRLYDERVATAQLRGLYQRLRADPHFQPRPPPPSPPADPLQPFLNAVRAVYPAQAPRILA